VDYPARVEVLSPRSLEEALELKAERPDARPIQGGTDVMVELNFDRARPEAILNLNEVAELRGWTRENGTLRLGAGLTYTEAMEAELAGLLPALAEASRTVGSPQIRNRGTIGGNLGTASPAGDALPPLLVEGAEVEAASAHGTRTLPLAEFLVGPKQNALAEDELILAVRLAPSGARQTFMNVCGCPLGLSLTASTSSSSASAFRFGPRKNSVNGSVRTPRTLPSSTTASSTSSGGWASPAGDAVPRLPPIVPRLRICGEPTVREASASAGRSSASSGRIASV